MRSLKLLLAALCFCLFSAVSSQADPVIIPLPLDSPVAISLSDNPVLTIGNRTIDFTPSLNQEFIHFMPVVQQIGVIGQDPVFRVTLGIRSLEGLSTVSGSIPLSPDPSFINQLPVFNVGTTDLLLFDFIISGYGTPFSITLTDVNGHTSTAHFDTPIPEPSTLILLGTGLAGIGAALRKRRRGSTGEQT